MSRFIAAGLVLLLAAAAVAVALQIDRAPTENRTELQLLIARSRLVGDTDPAQALTVNLNLRGRDATGLQRLLRTGQTVTPPEFDARFGPDPALVAVAQRSLDAAGLQPRWQPGSSLLTVQGAAGAIARLLKVAFHDYIAPDGTRFYAADREPTLPSGLTAVVTGVSGLDSYARYQRQAVRPGGLTPADVLAFYNIKGLRDRGLDGSGETIVFPEIDDLPNQNDLQKFAERYGLPPFDVTVKRDSSWGQPQDAGKPGFEVTLDIEIAHAIAPGAKLVAYIGGARQDQSSRLFDQMVRDDLGAIISDSIGACELQTAPVIRQAAADQNDRAVAQGMTHMVASGDLGAYGCGPDKQIGVDFPSALPNVTSVGGTTLFESTQGVFYRETAWGGAIGQAGSGGGLSHYYDRPDYQSGPGVQNKDSNGKRQVPDVAAVADVYTGWALTIQGGKTQMGGTSAAAPLWAAVIALVNQDLKKKGLRRVGFANPAIYWMGQNLSKFQSPPFHDVREGNNLFYDATQGWDYGTGWGSFDAVALDAAFETYIRQGGR